MKKQQPDKEWEGLPKFTNEKNTPYKKIIMTFFNQDDVDAFAKLIDQKITDRTKTMYYPAIPRPTVYNFWVDDEE